MSVKLNLQDRKLANYFAEYPLNFSVPFYFGNPTDPKSEVNNGTATLLKRRNKHFVVTNHHVLSKFIEREKLDPGVHLCVGGLIVENVADRILFDDGDLDISVVDFSDKKKDEFKMFGNIPTNFYELGDLQPLEQAGTVVAFGGYPRDLRNRIDVNKMRFNSFSSGASVVHGYSDQNIVVSINHNESLITSLSGPPAPEDLRGMSGGPVFKIVVERNMQTLRFAGIIYEFSTDFKVMRAKPLDLFSSALI